VAEAARRGLEARFSFGVIVARPYSAPHCWAEVRVDGRWWPVDPLLVRLLQGWGGIDPAAWDENDSPAPLFRRLADDNTIVVSHRGVWASTSLNAERLTCPPSPMAPPPPLNPVWPTARTRSWYSIWTAYSSTASR